jgi:hypothetical protein
MCAEDSSDSSRRRRRLPAPKLPCKTKSVGCEIFKHHISLHRDIHLNEAQIINCNSKKYQLAIWRIRQRNTKTEEVDFPPPNRFYIVCSADCKDDGKNSGTQM